MTYYETNLLISGAFELLAVVWWVWIMFYGGADWVREDSFIIHWPPMVTKVFMTLFLLMTTFIFLMFLFQVWPVT